MSPGQSNRITYLPAHLVGTTAIQQSSPNLFIQHRSDHTTVCGPPLTRRWRRKHIELCHDCIVVFHVTRHFGIYEARITQGERFRHISEMSLPQGAADSPLLRFALWEPEAPYLPHRDTLAALVTSAVRSKLLTDGESFAYRVYHLRRERWVYDHHSESFTSWRNHSHKTNQERQPVA